MQKPDLETARALLTLAHQMFEHLDEANGTAEDLLIEFADEYGSEALVLHSLGLMWTLMTTIASYLEIDICEYYLWAVQNMEMYEKGESSKWN